MTQSRTNRLVFAGIGLVVVAACGLAIAGIFFMNTRFDDSAAPSPTTAPAAMAESSPERGLLIIHVLPDSAAAEAGLTWGQFILAVDEMPVTETAAFTNAVAAAGPGGVVRLTILQGTNERTQAITLADAPPLLGVQVVAPGGLDLAAPDEPDQPETDAPSATAVPLLLWPLITEVDPDSPAAQADLAVDDVITAVDGSAVLTADELVSAIQTREPGTAVTLTIRRGPDTLTRTVTLAPHPEDAERPYLGITLGS